MAKFDFKGIAKNVMNDGKDILLIGGGIMAAQKFADFKTLFPNVDPNKVWIKHEGGIKFGAAMITLAVFKKLPQWAKCLIMGVAIQGLIKETRTLTMNAAGEAFVKQIGDGDYNQQINDLAEEIKNMSGADNNGANSRYSSVSGNNNNGANSRYSSVSGNGGNAVLLDRNSQTGVSGMGTGDDDI